MSDVEKRLKRIERLLQEMVDQGKPASTTIHVSNIDDAFRREQVEQQQEALKFNPSEFKPDLSKFHEKVREVLEEQKGAPALDLDLSEAAKQLNEFRKECEAEADDAIVETENLEEFAVRMADGSVHDADWGYYYPDVSSAKSALDQVIENCKLYGVEDFSRFVVVRRVRKTVVSAWVPLGDEGTAGAPA